MNIFLKTSFVLSLFSSLLYSDAVKLQNGDNYTGCEDGYLSALYGDSDLKDMVADTLTNHFSEQDIYLTR